VELVRNPEFEEWSGAAQPGGFVDAISWRFDEDTARAYAKRKDGNVDAILSPPPPRGVAALASAPPDQVVRSGGPFTLYVGFDVRKPPFDDVRLRQALSYAIDRERIVDLLGGPTQQRLTCQILPPNFQGYLPYCPYTDQ